MSRVLEVEPKVDLTLPTAVSDVLTPYREEDAARARITEEAQRAIEMISGVRKRARGLTERADLVKELYVGRFLPDMIHAAGVARQLTQGRVGEIDADWRQLVEVEGESPEAFERYLAGFEILDTDKADYPFPRVNFPAQCLIEYDGTLQQVENSLFSPWDTLDPFRFSPKFAARGYLPVLIDPQPHTFAELNELDDLDPGHARQLFEGRKTLIQDNRNQGWRFKDPKVVRMIAVLPVPQDPRYQVNYLPEVQMDWAGLRWIWDPRLLVQGRLNEGGDYLRPPRYGSTYDARVVAKDPDGRGAGLKIAWAEPPDIENQGVLPSPDWERTRLGLYLVPHHEIEVPRRERMRSDDEVWTPLFNGAAVTQSASVTRSMGAGETNVGVSGWWAPADKRETDVLGHKKVVPLRNGQPFIYSIRTLAVTAEA